MGISIQYSARSRVPCLTITPFSDRVSPTVRFGSLRKGRITSCRITRRHHHKEKRAYETQLKVWGCSVYHASTWRRVPGAASQIKPARTGECSSRCSDWWAPDVDISLYAE